MVVALLFAGSVVASPEGHENITLGMKPSFGRFTLNNSETAKENLFGTLSRRLQGKEVEVATVVAPTPTRFARFKEVVVNNPYKTSAAIVVTVAVIAAVVAYAKSSQADEVVAEEENYFA